MAHPTLLDRHLVFVTGKGGTGKSTVSAALAVLAARAGRRVLLCEVNAPQGRAGPLLAGQPGDGALAELYPGVHALNVHPGEAMSEYGRMVLRFRAVYHAVFENRLVRYFLRVIPSLAELVVLGKILHEARSTRPGGGPRWDLVLVDAPSTGHAVQLLRVPSALVDAVPAGPLRHDAEWMERLLVDAVRTAVVLVTLPEEMAVNEVIELDAQVRGVLGMARAELFVNALSPSAFAPEEGLSLTRAAAAPFPLGPAARAAELALLRAEAGRRQLARARSALDLPTTLIPLFPSAEWGKAQVEQVAEAIAAGWAEEGR
ncbi:MAG TPA: ArsA-related P-loop ATPase [Anaeromyxobacter sp.]|nr:ArsA-related P-loop ATPase [Anaeromyxobacter sp.]